MEYANYLKLKMVFFVKYSDNGTYENCCKLQLLRLLASLRLSQIKFIVFYSFLILSQTYYKDACNV